MGPWKKRLIVCREKGRSPMAVLKLVPLEPNRQSSESGLSSSALKA